MTRSSRTRCSRKTSILLSDIKLQSTCITLRLPLSLACEKCKPDIDILSFTRKKRKSKDRLKNKRNRCSQYWDSHWVTGGNATEGNVLQHRKVRNYLGIESDITIDYYCYYANNNESLTSLKNNESGPVEMHTIDNANNDNSLDEEDRHAIDPPSEDPITHASPVVAMLQPNKRQKHNFSDEFRSFLARKLPRKFTVFEKNETCEWYQNDD